MKEYKELTPVFVHGLQCDCKVDQRECDGYESLPTEEEYQQIVAAYQAGNGNATPIPGWNIGAEESLRCLGAM